MIEKNWNGDAFKIIFEFINQFQCEFLSGLQKLYVIFFALQRRAKNEKKNTNSSVLYSLKLYLPRKYLPGERFFVFSIYLRHTVNSKTKKQKGKCVKTKKVPPFTQEKNHSNPKYFSFEKKNNKEIARPNKYWITHLFICHFIGFWPQQPVGRELFLGKDLLNSSW